MRGRAVTPTWAGLTLVAGLAMAGCAPVPPPAADEGAMRLVRMNGAAVPAGITLRLSDDGSFSGDGMCNGYGGRNAATPPAFRAVGVNTTMMACVDNDRMARDAAYHAALGNARAITETPAGITLTGTGVELVYER